ncbi:MobP3 family relaxase [Paenibacillus graminis]|uniref:MobP3 family relaxase n=1 Tax=Paenibacillus graminis TaxID=189425 RepID=UPI0004B7C595|nr:MobP3 family relaxase [Paenibacillus graminis]
MPNYTEVLEISALIYKQRFFHPNRPKTAVSNYVHIGYIATRPGAVRHENLPHGLFGKMQPGSIDVFQSWQEVARIARDISKQGKNMYRSVISLRTETAMELGLNDFEAWQQYIEQHIATLAAHNRIKTENLCWAAAFHNEKDHPHLHIVFWDKEQTIMKNFTHPEIPNRIRKQLIKDTFAFKIKEFCAERDLAKTGITNITDAILEQFEAHMKSLNPQSFRALRQRFEHADEDSLLRLPKHNLTNSQSVEQLASHLLQLRHALPKNGRLAYQLLTPEAKSLVDEFVQDLLQQNPYLAEMVETYVKAKLEVAKLYTSDPAALTQQSIKYQAEAEKRIANRILSTVRTIIQLEQSSDVAIRQVERYRTWTEQLILELLSVMEQLSMQAQLDYDDKAKVVFGGEWSKQAKKEWLLRQKDKGVDR